MLASPRRSQTGHGNSRRELCEGTVRLGHAQGAPNPRGDPPLMVLQDNLCPRSSSHDGCEHFGGPEQPPCSTASRAGAGPCASELYGRRGYCMEMEQGDFGAPKEDQRHLAQPGPMAGRCVSSQVEQKSSPSHCLPPDSSLQAPWHRWGLTPVPPIGTLVIWEPRGSPVPASPITLPFSLLVSLRLSERGCF